MQVLIDRALTESRLEVCCRLVALELAIVLQPVWAKFADIAVDILGRLLATNIEGAAKVIGSQAPLPLQNYLQPVS